MKVDKTKTFLARTSIAQLVEFYDLLPDILFWIKDTDSRIIYANDVFIKHLGLQTLEQVVTKNDYDFSPPHIAKQFINDDKLVMQGHKVTNRMELNICSNGDIAWYATTKRCLKNDNNNIIGTYGFTRHSNKTNKVTAYMTELEVPINYITANYQLEISIETLAEKSHLSVSALERRFKKHLSKTPKQFINEFRLEKARQLLVETTLPIAQVGYQVGFSDASYFAKMFKQLFDVLPSEMRNHS